MGKNRFGREDSGTQVQKSGRQLDGGGGGGGVWSSKESKWHVNSSSKK